MQIVSGKVFGAGLVALLLVTGSSGEGYAQAGKKSAHFNINSVRSGPGMQMTVTGEVWVTTSRARMEVKDPMAGEALVLVTNGYIYQLDKKTKKGMRVPLPPAMKNSTDNFNFFMSQFAFDATTALKNAKKVRSEAVSGITCDVLTRTATSGDATRTVTVWMPQKQQPQFPIKVFQEDKLQKPGANLNESMTITLSNVQVGIDVPDSRFVIPTGYNIQTAKPGAAKPGAPGRPSAGKKK